MRWNKLDHPKTFAHRGGSSREGATAFPPLIELSVQASLFRMILWRVRPGETCCETVVI